MKNSWHPDGGGTCGFVNGELADWEEEALDEALAEFKKEIEQEKIVKKAIEILERSIHKPGDTWKRQDGTLWRRDPDTDEIVSYEVGIGKNTP